VISNGVVQIFKIRSKPRHRRSWSSNNQAFGCFAGRGRPGSTRLRYQILLILLVGRDALHTTHDEAGVALLEEGERYALTVYATHGHGEWRLQYDRDARQRPWQGDKQTPAATLLRAKPFGQGGITRTVF
jgi:hypothetical protein